MLKVVTEVLSHWGMNSFERKSKKLYFSCSLTFLSCMRLESVFTSGSTQMSSKQQEKANNNETKTCYEKYLPFKVTLLCLDSNFLFTVKMLAI